MQIRKPFVQKINLNKFLNYFFGEMTVPQTVFFQFTALVIQNTLTHH